MSLYAAVFYHRQYDMKCRCKKIIKISAKKFTVFFTCFGFL